MKWAWVYILVAISAVPAIASNRPVPKDRAALNGGDWFPYVISKLAPLEWWNFAASVSDLRRDEFPNDWSYDLAKQNTDEFPRFCFSMFRPSPETYAALLIAVQQYKGDVIWQFHDDCIGAFAAPPTFYSAEDAQNLTENLEELSRNPPQPNPEFVKRAVADIPHLCSYLETRLELRNKTPLEFDPHWLTRDGLASSRPPFENFVEPGSWSVILAKDPVKFAQTGQPTSPADLALNFGIGMFDSDALFKELGANWDKHQVEGGSGPILPDYPLLSRMDDITVDAIYQPDEIEGLLAEYLRAQQIVKDPRSIRGLDCLIRTAQWAQKLGVGIYFGGQ